MALQTSMLTLPGTYLGIVRDKALDNGILGQLAPEKPTLFGPVKGATFSGVPRASIVGESEAKPVEDPFSLTPFSAEPVKFVTQVRVSDEFKWGDDDYRMGILRDLVAPAIGSSIGRAVDLFAFHGINPKSGTVSAKAVKYLSQATNVVTAAGSPSDELEAAVGLNVAELGMPTGIAMDHLYSYQLATERYPQGHSLAGQRMYPGMGYGGATDWAGLPIRSSTTVSGAPEITTATGIKAFVGDWSQVRWGFQRNFPLEIIEYGDPDNTGRDLKAHNENLFRVEAVIYVAIGDLDKFAVVKDAPAGA